MKDILYKNPAILKESHNDAKLLLDIANLFQEYGLHEGYPPKIFLADLRQFYQNHSGTFFDGENPEYLFDELNTILIAKRTQAFWVSDHLPTQAMGKATTRVRTIMAYLIYEFHFSNENQDRLLFGLCKVAAVVYRLLEDKSFSEGVRIGPVKLFKKVLNETTIETINRTFNRAFFNTFYKNTGHS